MEIQGKIAVVTGAGSGIGRATAMALAKEGADVVLADINDDRLEEARKEIAGLGRKALAVHCDVSKLEDARALFGRSVAEMGRVDILMNNAGVHISGPVEKIAIADWEWILGINLWGVIHGINVFLPHMLERGSGHIINTASIAGLLGVADPSIPYTTTKFAVTGLSEGLAVYLRMKGIGVTVVCPGLVQTNIAEDARRIPVGDGLDSLREAFFEAFKRGERPEFAQIEAEILEPDVVADLVVRAVKENRFLVCTHANTDELIMARAQDIDGLIEQRARERAQALEQLRAFAAAGGLDDKAMP
jgi:NAD(P)-dependent dehydrogenase (short-subunit alcohol dehydrogenase family)